MPTLLYPLALLVFLTPLVAPCDTETCRLGCQNADLAIHNCLYDHQGYSSLENCVGLSAGTLSDNVQGLLDCLACNQPLGNNEVGVYEHWPTVCEVYLIDGESAAVSIDADPDLIVSYVSSMILLQAQSLCPEAFGGEAPASSTSSDMAMTTPAGSDSMATDSAAPTGSSEDGGTTDDQTSSSNAAAPAMTAKPHYIPIGMIAMAPLLALA